MQYLNGMKDYAKGEHYHCLTEAMRNSHSGDHWKAGDLIPEPWASIYFLIWRKNENNSRK